jgi:hypothetical protein
MEQRFRWLWAGVVFFTRPVTLKFGDEDLHFLFRRIPQIRLECAMSAVRGSGGQFLEDEARPTLAWTPPEVAGFAREVIKQRGNIGIFRVP